MARFPIRESEIESLAQDIAVGLTGNTAIYPAPPSLHHPAFPALHFLLYFRPAFSYGF